MQQYRQIAVLQLDPQARPPADYPWVDVTNTLAEPDSHTPATGLALLPHFCLLATGSRNGLSPVELLIALDEEVIEAQMSSPEDDAAAIARSIAQGLVGFGGGHKTV